MPAFIDLLAGDPAVAQTALPTGIDAPRSSTGAKNIRPGRLVAVRGTVLDVEFLAGDLPEINDALVIEWSGPEPLVAEVLTHLNEHRVRAVAMQSAEGLRRGLVVRSAGGPIAAPVATAERRKGRRSVGIGLTPSDIVFGIDQCEASVGETFVTPSAKARGLIARLDPVP